MGGQRRGTDGSVQKMEYGNDDMVRVWLRQEKVENRNFKKSDIYFYRFNIFRVSIIRKSFTILRDSCFEYLFSDFWKFYHGY